MLHKCEIKYSTLNGGRSVERIIELPMDSSKLPKLSRWKVTSIVAISVIAFVFIVYAAISPYGQINENLTVLQQASQTQRLMIKDRDYVRIDADSGMRSDKIRYKHTKRHLPQCIIIGCRKAGTRALLSFLNLHSQIQIAKNEVHFFDDEEAYSNGLEWYRKKMPYAFNDQITIEKTPAYFTNYDVPKRVAKMNSTIKLLLIVRDPTERTISDYLQLHVNKIDKEKATKSFEEAVTDPETGQLNIHYPPLKRSLYYRYMWDWLQSFDLDQFLILSGEELIKDPLPQLRRVETFLNLEREFSRNMFYFNKTRGFYCIRNDTMQKCLNDSKGRKHPDVDPTVISMMHRYFAPYNQQFYKLVKWNFDWPEE